MQQNITMQQLKEQRMSPAEKFVLDTIKGAKSSKPDKYGEINWFKNGECIFIQCFNDSCFTDSYLWVSYTSIWGKLKCDYSLNHGEIETLLTRLLRKYTNNGELQIRW
jgi:hypothetical protein